MPIPQRIAKEAYVDVANEKFGIKDIKENRPYKAYFGSRAKLSQFRRELIWHFARANYICNCMLTKLLASDTVKDQIKHIAETTTVDLRPETPGQVRLARYRTEKMKK